MKPPAKPPLNKGRLLSANFSSCLKPPPSLSTLSILARESPISNKDFIRDCSSFGTYLLERETFAIPLFALGSNFSPACVAFSLASSYIPLLRWSELKSSYGLKFPSRAIGGCFKPPLLFLSRNFFAVTSILGILGPTTSPA